MTTCRVIRIVLIILGITAMAAWAVFYVWIHGMACAFSSPNATSCGIDMPWTLRGEDLNFLVLIPGGIIAVIFLGVWLLRPQNRAS